MGKELAQDSKAVPRPDRCKVTVVWTRGKPSWGTGEPGKLAAIKMPEPKIGSMGIG